MGRITNILVIRTDNLGDVLLTLPVLKKIKESNPETNIDLIAQESFRDFLKMQTYLRRVISYKPTVFGKLILLLKLVLCNHELVVNAVTRSDTFSSLCLAITRARHKRGFNNSLQKYFLTQKISPPHKIIHEIEFVKKLFPEQKIPRIPDFQSTANKSNLIAISPFASRDVKEWPIEYWKEFLEKIIKTEQAEIYVFGLPKHKSVLEKLNLPNIKVITNWNLVQFYEFLKKASLHITVNNGAMHLAAMVGTPQVLLNGPSSLTRWRPLQKKVVVISSNLDCVQSEETCGSYELCLKNNGACMNAIEVDEVVDAFKKQCFTSRNTNRSKRS